MLSFLAVFRSEENEDLAFADAMHQWAIFGSALFSNVVRHCVESEAFFEEAVNSLIVRSFR